MEHTGTQRCSIICSTGSNAVLAYRLETHQESPRQYREILSQYLEKKASAHG